MTFIHRLDKHIMFLLNCFLWVEPNRIALQNGNAEIDQVQVNKLIRKIKLADRLWDGCIFIIFFMMGGLATLLVM